MPMGIPKTAKQVICRPAGQNLESQPELKVLKVGPFFEVWLNDIFVGKVTRLVRAYCAESADDCSGYCIRLSHCIIVLTDSEEQSIVYEQQLNRERSRI